MARDLSGTVYRQLKADLIAERSHLEGLITEQMIADHYGVSKTPAREAATRLLYEGYLVKYPSKGYVMRKPSEQEVKEITEYRYFLECGILERIIQTATDEEIKNLLFAEELQNENSDFGSCLSEANLSFHLTMAKLAGNSFVVNMLENTLYLLVRHSVVKQRGTYEAVAKNFSDTSTPFHFNIIQALLSRDYTRAKEELMHDIFSAP